MSQALASTGPVTDAVDAPVQDFERTLDALLARRPRELPRELTVYGAGSMGRDMARLLEARGHRVASVLDRDAAAHAGLPWPLHTADAWLAKPGGCRAVLIAIHSPGFSVAQLAPELAALGFGPIFTAMDIADAYPTDVADRFWLAPKSVYSTAREPLRALHARLADTKSRAVLAETLAFRLGQLDAPRWQCEGGQYQPRDLPRWRQPLRLIDCGAYVGDTVEALLDAGQAVESAACFEPDPRNFEQLASALARRKVPGLCLPCAVSDSNALLRFDAHSSASSHQSDSGATTVQAVRLDDALPGFAPTLLKMDIEGAEPAALAGARGLIATSRPALAISIYHAPNHLWEIPLSLAEALPGYTFHLRSHAWNTFDLVLYGLPPATFGKDSA